MFLASADFKAYKGRSSDIIVQSGLYGLLEKLRFVKKHHWSKNRNKSCSKWQKNSSLAVDVLANIIDDFFSFNTDKSWAILGLLKHCINFLSTTPCLWWFAKTFLFTNYIVATHFASLAGQAFILPEHYQLFLVRWRIHFRGSVSWFISTQVFFACKENFLFIPMSNFWAIVKSAMTSKTNCAVNCCSYLNRSTADSPS